MGQKKLIGVGKKAFFLPIPQCVVKGATTLSIMTHGITTFSLISIGANYSNTKCDAQNGRESTVNRALNGSIYPG
jgi:hypothetical protein